MFPQTHVYFAGLVLDKMSDEVALGSVFPDMAIGAGVNRDVSHNSGKQLFEFLRQEGRLQDFALANITHGVTPDGLDYYGDEKNPPYERGYCFEKGRSLVDDTIKACHIPPEMGWWKAHNIVEMGIEMRICSSGEYGRCLYRALHNRELIESVSERLGEFYGVGTMPFARRMSSFPSYIDLSDSTAESLAAKYDYQMQYKHRISINIQEVARLIRLASEMIEEDIDQFFITVADRVKKTLGLVAPNR